MGAEVIFYVGKFNFSPCGAKRIEEDFPKKISIILIDFYGIHSESDKSKLIC